MTGNDETLPKKSGKKSKKDIIFLVIVCLLIFCGTYFALSAFSDYNSHKQARDTWSDLRNEAYDPDFVPDANAYDVRESSNDNKSSDDKSQKPSSDMLLKIDFDKLQKKNGDVVAWIRIPDTQVDYPVMQEPVYPLSADVKDPKYLHKDIYGNDSISGSLFITANYKNIDDLAHKIIYGHNMKDGSMFAVLSEYKNKDFLTEHPYFYVYYPDRTEKYIICSAAHTDDSSAIYKSPYHIDTNDYQDLIDHLMRISYYDMNKEFLNRKTRTITLSTCDWISSDDGGRLAVTGSLCDTLYWSEVENGGE